MTINFQRLLDVAKATELLPLGGFMMDEVLYEVDESDSSCGTAGCMIGNYNRMVGRDAFSFGDGVDDHLYFGISRAEYDFLFAEGDNVFSKIRGRVLCKVTRPKALSRLRKFIYFKMHKHEMTYDERYGVSDRGRKAEGNQNFAGRAKAKAAELATV